MNWDGGTGDGKGCILAGCRDYNQTTELGASGDGWEKGKGYRRDTKAEGRIFSCTENIFKLYN